MKRKGHCLNTPDRCKKGGSESWYFRYTLTLSVALSPSELDPLSNSMYLCFLFFYGFGWLPYPWGIFGIFLFATWWDSYCISTFIIQHFAASLTCFHVLSLWPFELFHIVLVILVQSPTYQVSIPPHKQMGAFLHLYLPNKRHCNGLTSTIWNSPIPVCWWNLETDPSALLLGL